MYSDICYGIEVYGLCSDTSLERLQVIQNKLLKLLLRLDPYTSTNLLHSELNILEVKDLYDTSLLLFVYANLQGDCPAALKDYFVTRNSAYNTRQMGHLEYRRAQMDLGTSGVQYHAAELLNLVSKCHKKIFHIENISSVIYVKNLYKDTVNNFTILTGEMSLVTRVAKGHKLLPMMIIFCTILKLFLVTVIVV